MAQPDLLQSKKVLKTIQWPHPQFLNNAFLDPYVGCEYGCAYCYGIKEPNQDNGDPVSPFRVGVKTNCAFSLKKELEGLSTGNPNPKKGNISIGIGFATDPYQNCEAQFHLTLRALEILKAAQYPIQIITKSELILRDAGILAELSQEGMAAVSVSIFTMDESVSRLFEPRVIAPKKRLDLIEKLKGKGVTCGAVLMPIIPYITDTEEDLDRTFAALKGAGALYCVPGILSLGHAVVRDRMMKILSAAFPRVCYQYSVLFDASGKPSASYCGKIEKILKSSAEKYEIPSVLPVLGYSEKQDLIVQDTI